MNPFNLTTDPLEGVTLIEAGAGTGKTYTLTGIFLRLIVERGLTVDQILVVTYTKAATEELKTRIRLGLLQVKSAFAQGRGRDAFDTMLLDQAKDRSLAYQRIHDALTDFDRAAIYTIHGFCQRLLQQFAFETGNFFNSELVRNSQPYIQELADDFWRRHISRAPYELARYAVDALKGPDQLAKVLGTCRYPNVNVRPDPDKVALHTIRPWRKSAHALQSSWRKSGADIIKLLEFPALYARSYGKCEPHPDRMGQSCRQVVLQDLAAAMEQWNGRYPLFERIDRFSQSYLESHTKKHHPTPEHPFFALCDRAIECHRKMESQLGDYLRYLKVRLFRAAGEILERKKISQNILFFDDLLLLVHRALNSRRAGELLSSVRSQYRAALVDEFQDTDPLQYEIFHRLFARKRALLALIGDPKQAIYSFRGADLFSYLKAAGQAAEKTTLTRNWRSSPALITAVNTIFERHTRPFGFADIDFRAAVAADAATPDDQSGSPFTLWVLTRTGADTPSRPISQQEAVPKIAAAVAEEICTLLSDGTGSTYAPEQIAVLTRTHDQSQVVKNALAAKNVPAVLHGAGSVFHTRESSGMAHLLAAVAQPGDSLLANTLLAADYYSLHAEDFLEGEQGRSPQWQACWSALVKDHQLWVKKGFYAMFRNWMAREKVKARLLSMPDGERRLTNLIHLGELLHQAEVDHRLSMDGLVKWLAGRRRSENAAGEEQQLRLESDSRAVRIITMHKSKGLEFDVVFCPFVWGGVRTDQSAVVFHDPQNHHALTLSLGPGIDPGHQLHARREALAENLRMLYVALTRAIKRCYMVWGRINGSEISAPAYLFHGSRETDNARDPMASLQDQMNSLTDARCIGDLHQLAKASGGVIAVDELPRGSHRLYQEKAAPAGVLECRKLRRSIRPNWRISSFSALTAAVPPEQREWPDRDNTAEPAPEPPLSVSPFESLFDFPRGARAGLFFHDLLEHWVHTETDRRRVGPLIRSKLKIHGFDLRWENAIDTLLAHLGQATLAGQYDRFCLSQVSMSSRINEMSFYFPLKAFNPVDLAGVLQEAGQGSPLELRKQWKMDRLVFMPTPGLMKGYVDTILRHNGRYYILDWKSNYLGPTADHYSIDCLQRAMVEEYYFLQYLFYTVAVDQMLRQKIDGYTYGRHFGGVLYLFLRGIAVDRKRTGGIFYALPDESLIEALRALMIEP